VVSENNGTWGQAISVPGLRALGAGPYTDVRSVSCASPGNCAAGGWYIDARDHSQGYVAVETNGVWGMAIEVPGLESLNKDGDASVDSVSCAPAGNCAAGGSYRGAGHGVQGFVT
jgi:hypothetical protein